MIGLNRSSKTSMKYCYHCNRKTQGEPLFCGFCGRSYDIKLCPRLHVNPRIAQVCSRCGSHDLSTPQPSLPMWAVMLLFLIALGGGYLLIWITGSLILALLNPPPGPDMPMKLVVIGLVLVLVWWGWLQLPHFFRKAIHRLLQRRRLRK